MKLELKKGYLVDHHEIIEGKVLLMPVFHDGISEYKNKMLFTVDGEKFIKEDWMRKIFKDKSRALVHLESERESSIKSAEKQLKYYQDRIKQLSQ